MPHSKCRMPQAAARMSRSVSAGIKTLFASALSQRELRYRYRYIMQLADTFLVLPLFYDFRKFDASRYILYSIDLFEMRR